MQSAMCAFDCAQVLAEWISTVQERVGRYIGILGKSDIDYDAVPAVMYVDVEDTALFAKIDEILGSAEIKMAIDTGGLGAVDVTGSQSGLPNLDGCCYGSKILMVTAYMLKKSAVWPGQCFPLFRFSLGFLADVFISSFVNGALPGDSSCPYDGSG